MKFRATVVPSGNAAGVQVPEHVMHALDAGGRPPVTITINGHEWRSRVAAMRGVHLIGISAANRAAAGIAEGEIVEVEVALDSAPREVIAPPDLAAAFALVPGAEAAFGAMPFGLKQKHVRHIETSSSDTVRRRRIGKLVASLGKTD